LVEVILFLLIVVAGTGGELCVSRAMKAVGEVKDFRPRAIVRVVLRALRVGWMWAGVGMMALAFFSLLGALTFLNVSFVVPVTALSYVAGALGAVFFLRERVGRRRWTGVFLVSLGVTLVFLSKR
jgi:drug/metabolite transporter (DMT)-like permease